MDRENAPGDVQPAPGPGEEGITIARRYDKQTRAADKPCALGWIRQVYPDAIEYRTMTKSLHGIGVICAALIGLPLIFIGLGCAFIGVSAIPFDGFTSVLKCLLVLALSALVVFGGAHVVRMSIETDLFLPEDLPILFDRKHRKVCRLLREEPAGLAGVFRWPRIVAREYEWDLVDAEYRLYRDEENPSGPEDHALTFLVRKSRDEATPIDRFNVADTRTLGKGLVDPMWEHIRRFMEDGGPHLPDPAERLAAPEAPGSISTSMRAVGLLDPLRYKRWKKAPVLGVLSLLFAPVTLPLLLLWGVGHYLSARTAIPVRWPDIVTERVGLPMAGRHSTNGAA
jgi:hypothetical protein